MDLPGNQTLALATLVALDTLAVMETRRRSTVRLGLTKGLLAANAKSFNVSIARLCRAEARTLPHNSSALIISKRPTVLG